MQYLLGRFKTDTFDVILTVVEADIIKLSIRDTNGIPIINQRFASTKTAVQTYENLLETMEGQRIN